MSMRHYITLAVYMDSLLTALRLEIMSMTLVLWLTVVVMVKARAAF